MLAAKNIYIQEASESLFELCAEDQIREQCEAREEYYRMERTRQSVQQALMNKLSDTETALIDTQNELAQFKSENQRLKAQLQALQRP